jgi:hypothetical protein
MKHLLLIFLSGVATSTSWAQPDSLHRPIWQLSGYLETFYAYDFNRPGGVSRQDFLFNHNRHHEFNLNLGLIRMELEHTRYRAAFALQAGTYVMDNYAEEPEGLRPIHEARVGVSLDAGSTLWLDMGIFSSHIGFESAIGTENMTLTRSLLAENSPYFLSGAKLCWSPNSHWEVEALLLNGWQRIQRLPGNSALSGGSRITYTSPSGKVLNWSTFIGTDDPDPARRMRYFSNLYGIIPIAERWKMILGYDIGWQQTVKGGGSYHQWMSLGAILRYAWTDAWAVALRAEHYADPDLVIISGVEEAFRTSGISTNLDFSPASGLMLRTEVRWLHANRPLFERAGGPVRDNVVVGMALAVDFSK